MPIIGISAREIADRCPGAHRVGNGYRAPCPAHGGKNNNLSIIDLPDGVKMKCFSHGCATNAILNAIGVHGKSSPGQHQQLPPVRQVVCANVADLGRVYSSMVDMLHLEDGHLLKLGRRGLSRSEISHRAYGSMPLQGRFRIATELVKHFGVDLISRIPGFIQRQSRHNWYWTLGGFPGLLIPVRDLHGTIVSLIVRLDDFEGGGKYRWLSSRHHGGPGPLASCHVPLHDSDARIIRLTEGALKADVATSLSGVLTLGIPGVGPWKLVLPLLEQLKPQTILLAFDADWRVNRHVGMSLGNCAKYLNQCGYRVQIESWRPEQGKGIDDLLLARHQPQRKPWQAALVAKHRAMARKREATRHG